ncbi:substrate-binding domain-containing protein [Actinokineospora spheciospongiae]|uniref:substrate-binding domain-containing protein n=1 Tax=Actinokineospora spheciospongiae TaxID=909613 RepID=UPI000D70EA61|nr:substrate-binding domain-containing protein [Actinokineospora spheciospongiae]PWW65665.1 von Willebrand factor type A domain-containing protein [Actinokineospora spheciospongiae]
MGRHSSGRGRPRPVVLVGLLVVVALVGWLGVTLVRGWVGPSCENPVTLDVAAAPEIAPLVEQFGKRVADDQAAGDENACYRVAVAAEDSTSVAEALAVSDSGALPDVWIPESTMVLRRAQAKGAFDGQVSGTSIASSPVVLALTDDTAGALGWPDKIPTWADVLATPAETAIGIPDPARDPVGTSAMFGVRTTTQTTPDPDAALTSTLRRISANTRPLAADLYARLPGAGSQDEPIDVIATTEHDLLKHNAAESGYELVATYSEPAVPSMDYPYTVLPQTAPAERDAALKFLGRLLDETSVRALADAGYRAADGRVLRDRSQDRRTGAEQVDRTEVPDNDAVDALLNQWAGANLAARVQVLMDVSGSMAQEVPGTDLDRMTVTTRAAVLGLGLFKPDTKLSYTLFSTNLDGDRDYKELLPMKPVRDHLAAGAREQVAAIKAVPGGATGLYDTVLAAYRSGRADWEPGRLNLVIIMTDGRNEDGNGINRDDLLAELDKLQDPRRPLPIVGVGIGPDVDKAELDALSAATGGKAFATADPTKISDIFYAALGKFLCQPPNCKAPEN